VGAGIRGLGAAREALPQAGGMQEARLDAAFKALASEQRREILRMLSECAPTRTASCCPESEVCACEFSERLGLAASTISHHMALLRDAGLIDARKDGLWVYYSLRRDALDWLSRAIAQL
jgi:ArsR family transcriptional regulator